MKRRRKYGQLAKTRKRLLEERIDRAEKKGTYEAGVAILQEHEETQQSSTNNKTKQTKVCSSCGKSGHKTFRTRTCPNHQQYVQLKTTKQPPVEKKTNTSSYLNETENSEQKVRKENGQKGDDNVGIKMPKGDFGVATLDVRATPLHDAVDVVMTSTAKKKGAGECLKLNEIVEDERNVQKKKCCGTSKYNSRIRTRSNDSTS